MEFEVYDKRVVERLIRQGKITPAQVTAHLESLPDLVDRIQIVSPDEELMNFGPRDKRLRAATMTDEDNED